MFANKSLKCLALAAVMAWIIFAEKPARWCIVIKFIKFEFSVCPTYSLLGFSLELCESSEIFYRYEIALLLGLFKRKFKITVHFWRW